MTIGISTPYSDGVYFFEAGMDQAPAGVAYGRNYLRREIAVVYPVYNQTYSPLQEFYVRSLKAKEMNFLGSESVYGLGLNFKAHLKTIIITRGSSETGGTLPFFSQELWYTAGPSVNFMLPQGRWRFIRWTIDIDMPFDNRPIKWGASISINARN